MDVLLETTTEIIETTTENIDTTTTYDFTTTLPPNPEPYGNDTGAMVGYGFLTAFILAFAAFVIYKVRQKIIERKNGYDQLPWNYADRILYYFLNDLLKTNTEKHK